MLILLNFQILFKRFSPERGSKVKSPNKIPSPIFDHPLLKSCIFEKKKWSKRTTGINLLRKSTFYVRTKNLDWGRGWVDGTTSTCRGCCIPGIPWRLREIPQSQPYSWFKSRLCIKFTEDINYYLIMSVTSGAPWYNWNHLASKLKTVYISGSNQ